MFPEIARFQTWLLRYNPMQDVSLSAHVSFSPISFLSENYPSF